MFLPEERPPGSDCHPAASRCRSWRPYSRPRPHRSPVSFFTINPVTYVFPTSVPVPVIKIFLLISYPSLPSLIIGIIRFPIAAARMHSAISPGTASKKQYKNSGHRPIGVFMHEITDHIIVDHAERIDDKKADEICRQKPSVAGMALLIRDPSGHISCRRKSDDVPEARLKDVARPAALRKDRESRQAQNDIDHDRQRPVSQDPAAARPAS